MNPTPVMTKIKTSGNVFVNRIIIQNAVERLKNELTFEGSEYISSRFLLNKINKAFEDVLK